MRLTYTIRHPGEPAAGLRSYTDEVTAEVGSGDPGGEPGEFEAHIRAALLEWFDGARVTLDEPRLPPGVCPECRHGDYEHARDCTERVED